MRKRLKLRAALTFGNVLFCLVSLICLGIFKYKSGDSLNPATVFIGVVISLSGPKQHLGVMEVMGRPIPVRNTYNQGIPSEVICRRIPVLKTKYIIAINRGFSRENGETGEAEIIRSLVTFSAWGIPSESRINVLVDGNEAPNFYPCCRRMPRIDYVVGNIPIIGHIRVGDTEPFTWTNILQRNPRTVLIAPLVLAQLYLSLNRFYALLGSVRLSLSSSQLLFRNESSVLGVNSSLLSTHFQNISLTCHLFKLAEKYVSSHYGNDEGENRRTKPPSSISDGGCLKDTKFIVLDDPCSQGFVYQSYWQWLLIFSMVIGGGIVGRCGVDVLLNDGRWGQRCSRLFLRASGREFTDRERVLVGLGAAPVAAFLFFHALITVTQKLLTMPCYCNTLIGRLET